MPIFEYRCESCDHTFDVLVLSSGDPDPVCPKCKKEDVKKLISAGHVHGGTRTGGGADACAPAGGG